MYIGKGSERQLVSMKSNSRGLVLFSWQLLQSHFFQNRGTRVIVKTKTRVIALANRIKLKQFDQSIRMCEAWNGRQARENAQASHDQFWSGFWLVVKVAWVCQPIAKRSSTWRKQSHDLILVLSSVKKTLHQSAKNGRFFWENIGDFVGFASVLRIRSGWRI